MDSMSPATAKGALHSGHLSALSDMWYVIIDRRTMRVDSLYELRTTALLSLLSALRPLLSALVDPCS